jgi:group I intron endonuclease
MFTNLMNGKQYIGSSKNLKIRFMEYFNKNRLLKYNYMPICCALLKYNSSNFAITILEYCEPDKCLIREEHYWNIFKPKYNIAKKPGAPFTGRTHSDETKQIISDALTGENNPMFGKTGENHPNYGKPRPEGAGRPSQQIEVTDSKNNTTTLYDSIREAERALDIR